MAEGSINRSETGSQQPQICSICFSEFKDPRMLDCSHTFCLKCLEELLKQAQNKDGENIACPLCRKETILPKGEVDKLPHLQEGVAEEEGQDRGQVPNVMCQACDEENEAISRCTDCEHYLCKECQRAHQRWAALRSHKIATLEELGSDSKHKDCVPKCKEHPKHELCLYCNSCDALICKQCTTSKHKKSSHFFDSIDTAFHKCSQEINEAVSQTTKCIQESDKVDIGHSRQRLATMLRRTKIQISLAAEEQIDKIKQEERKLRQEAQDLFAKMDKQFAFAATTNKTLCKVKNILSGASCFELLESKTRLLQDLREHTEIRNPSGTALRPSHKQSFICFTKCSWMRSGEKLGSLQARESWSGGNTTSHYGEAVTKPHLWTCLTAYSTGGLVMSRDNEFISCHPVVHHKKGTGYNPTVLKVNSDDELIILDGLSVKILNQDFQMLRQFIPGKVADIDDKPTCLAVDDNDIIAVGYKEKEQVSLHNPDGTLIKTLPAPKIENRLVVSNKRVIYTMENESDNCEITAVDFFGEKLFTISTNLSHGIPCCDEAGDIYFVTKDNLLHCSADGRIVQSWKFSFRLPRPVDVTNVSESEMYVLDGEILHIVSRH